MKQYFSLVFVTLLCVSIKAQPPNNAIFIGGSGDGISNSGWMIASANIFAGGEGDGFSFSENSVVPNPIYKGGEGDGFSFDSNNALPNDIFLGGEGDGWHAVVFPMGPLPVELLSFTAEYSGTSHLIKWATVAEINTRHFDLQRSNNARDFIKIGTVQPSGNNSLGASYNFMVDEPLSGNNFYRLKIVDNNGSFNYSNIVLLRNDGALKLSVYPNPTADVLHINIPPNADIAKHRAMVYDAQGKLIMQTHLKTGTLNSVFVGTLPSGIYTLRCIAGNQHFVLRFVKEK